jgi:hypothetical protein
MPARFYLKWSEGDCHELEANKPADEGISKFMQRNIRRPEEAQFKCERGYSDCRESQYGNEYDR